MKEYGNSKFYLGDCMEGMKEYPDKYFDLAITDPPYFEDYGKKIYPGNAISTTGVKRNRYKSEYWKVPGEEYFCELNRISRNQIIWGFNYFKTNILQKSGRIIWDKRNDSSTFSKAEIAYCSLHNSVQLFRYLWNGMLQENMQNKEIRIHPTQKPIALYKWLLSNYAKPGDKILDTHVGSASSLIACLDMDFEFVGYELDEYYYNEANKRIERFLSEPKFDFNEIF
jgi:site-specific DNA-methyltransferase (adenine-specific)